jgi:hypothetical protein
VLAIVTTPPLQTPPPSSAVFWFMVLLATDKTFPKEQITPSCSLVKLPANVLLLTLMLILDRSVGFWATLAQCRMATFLIVRCFEVIAYGGTGFLAGVRFPLHFSGI